MSYRDRGAALERIQRLEEALHGGEAPRRPLRWVKAMVYGLVAFALASVVVVSIVLVR